MPNRVNNFLHNLALLIWSWSNNTEKRLRSIVFVSECNPWCFYIANISVVTGILVQLM